jgi:hypothetical protein
VACVRQCLDWISQNLVPLFLTDLVITVCILDMLQAAIAATKATNNWITLYMARFPEIFKRCQKEIIQVLLLVMPGDAQYSVVCVSPVNLRLDSIPAEILSLHFTLEIRIITMTFIS